METEQEYVNQLIWTMLLALYLKMNLELENAGFFAAVVLLCVSLLGCLKNISLIIKMLRTTPATYGQRYATRILTLPLGT